MPRRRHRKHRMRWKPLAPNLRFQRAVLRAAAEPGRYTYSLSIRTCPQSKHRHRRRMMASRILCCLFCVACFIIVVRIITH